MYIYKTNNTSLYQLMQTLEHLRDKLTAVNAMKMKSDFAREIMLSFDYAQVFQKEKIGKEFIIDRVGKQTVKLKCSQHTLYPPVSLYLIHKPDHLLCFITPSVGEHHKMIAFEAGWDLVDILEGSQEDDEIRLQEQGLHYLLFTPSWVNVAYDWHYYIPSLDVRSELLVKHVMLNHQLSKKNLTLMEKLTMINEMKGSSGYKALYRKIKNSLPELDASFIRANKVTL